MQCRVCGCGDIYSLGMIPDCAEFAGQILSSPIKGGELWCCKGCGSMFRYPTLSSDIYFSLYEKAPNTVWVEGELIRNDFATIYTYLNNHQGGTVLDVGCYSGVFLAGLPERFQKYGVEPSDSASRCAESKGIDVLGKTLDEIDSELTFDLVISIDVVEHVLDVEGFLVKALSRVKENGLMIISTGNPNCFFWKRVFKSKFWYSLFAEHVTFPSYNYYVEMSKRLGLKSPQQIRFRYTKSKYIDRFSQSLRFFLYLFSPSVYHVLRKIKTIVLSNKDDRCNYSSLSISPIGIFLDHHVVIFRKKGL